MKNVGKKSVGRYTHEDIAAAFIEYEELNSSLKRLQKKQDSLLLAKTVEFAAKGGDIEKIMDKEIDSQEKEITKSRQAILAAYTKFADLEKAYWSRKVLKQAQPEDPLEGCGASIPKVFWKVGYGDFYASSQQGLYFSSVPPFFQANERSDPWADVYYSADGPLYNPSRCGVKGGWGYASGILGFGIDIGADMCGFELMAGISAEGIVSIGEGQSENDGVHINLSMEMAQYRGHNVPIANHGVRELHPNVGPEMYNYWSFGCAPGMQYSTNTPGMYSIPPFGNTCKVCSKDIEAGDSFVVEYQFSVRVSIGCDIDLAPNDLGRIVMQLPTFLRHEYPAPDLPTNYMVIT